MEVTADEIEVVSLSMLEKLVASGNSIAAVFSSSLHQDIFLYIEGWFNFVSDMNF